MTVSDLGEHALLARVLARLPRPGAQILVGPGDDAAVIAPRRHQDLVVTTDAMVEHVHFERAWSAAADIGHKALAVNLSDLAAMGATPRWALLSLGLPADFPVADVEALVDGLAALAQLHGVAVAGGNLTRSPAGLFVDVTAGGEVEARKCLTRAGGRPGDQLWVSGEIGAARAGLEMLRQRTDAVGPCVVRHRRPEPRIRLGIAMARGRAARAAMDLSDGLADAVRQMAAASGCGARIDLETLPVAAEARQWWHDGPVDAALAALTGGEDYELLFALPPRWGGRLRHVRSQVARPVLTKIGTLTREPGCRLTRGGQPVSWPDGFEHFRG